MAERNLGIRIEAKYQGHGFREAGQEAAAFDRNLDELLATLRRAESAFEKAQSNSIALKSEWKRLANSGKATTEELKELSQRISAAEDVEREAINTTRQIIKEFDNWEDESGQLNHELRDLENVLQRAQGHIDGVTQEVKTMGQGFGRVETAVQGTNQELNQLNSTARESDQKLEQIASSSQEARQELNRLGNTAEETSRATQSLNDNFVKFSAVGNLVAEGIEEAARAVVEFAKESVQAFYDFDRSSREIFTLIPEASGEMREQMQADVLALGTSLGRLPEEMLPAVYNALSSGVPQDNVLEYVKVASDAARAGVADLDTTLKLGTAILNAKVSGVNNLNDVYDQLFFTVKEGVITMPEMTEGLNAVTSVAGEAGVSLQDISAALIVMTRQGDSAQEAFELLSIMLTQLSTAGTTLSDVFVEASGRSFRQYIEEGGNLAGAMQLLQEHSQRTGQALGDILGGGSPFFRDTQAARGALELTGKHLESLIHFSNEAQNATGMMAEAAAEMGQSGEMGALQYAAAVAELKIATGEFLAESGTGLIQNATEFVKLFSGNRQREVHGFATAIEDVNTRALKLSDLMQEIDGPIGTMTGGLTVLKNEAALVAAEVGDFSAGNEELAESLNDVFGGGVQVANGMVSLNGILIGTVEELAAVNRELELQAALLYDRKLLQYNTSTQEAVEETRIFVDTHQEASLAFEVTAEQVAEAAIRQEEAMAAATQAALELRQAINDYALDALASIETTTNWDMAVQGAETVTINWKDELFQAGAQAGVTGEQFISLGLASGEYSQEALEAALKTAAMRVAIEELGEKMAAGELTTKQALEALENLEAQLENDYRAEIDYESVTKAKDEANSLKDRLEAIQGTYSAQVNVNTNYTNSGNPGPGNPVAMSSGGAFRAGELMIVGDGPGGQILPTTEMVMFDRPGQVIPGDITNQIVRALAGGGRGGNQYIINTRDNSAAVVAQLQARERNMVLEAGM